MSDQELRDLNTPNCTCGEDHNQLPHIVFAAFRLADYGLLGDHPTPDRIAVEVERIAKEVGWQQGSSEHTLTEICRVVFDTAGADDMLGDVVDRVVEQAHSNGWQLVR